MRVRISHGSRRRKKKTKKNFFPASQLTCTITSLVFINGDNITHINHTVQVLIEMKLIECAYTSRHICFLFPYALPLSLAPFRPPESFRYSNSNITIECFCLSRQRNYSVASVLFYLYSCCAGIDNGSSEEVFYFIFNAMAWVLGANYYRIRGVN